MAERPPAKLGERRGFSLVWGAASLPHRNGAVSPVSAHVSEVGHLIASAERDKPEGKIRAGACLKRKHHRARGRGPRANASARDIVRRGRHVDKDEKPSNFRSAERLAHPGARAGKTRRGPRGGRLAVHYGVHPRALHDRAIWCSPPKRRSTVGLVMTQRRRQARIMSCRRRVPRCLVRSDSSPLRRDCG